MSVVELKTYVVECDICHKTKEFISISSHDKRRFPAGWLTKEGEGVGGLLKDYHYCPRCSMGVSFFRLKP